jgi:hypothetical protein
MWPIRNTLPRRSIAFLGKTGGADRRRGQIPMAFQGVRQDAARRGDGAAARGFLVNAGRVG